MINKKTMVGTLFDQSVKAHQTSYALVFSL